MLFNLGMTADAAAAHNSELASSETQLPMPSRHSSPRPFSFTNLPSWGLGSRFSADKPADSERSRFEQRRSMPVTAIEPRSSSDEDLHSTAGPPPVRHLNQHKHPKPPASSRPKTSYQLAHPATNARHKRLKLRPKLLLQLQRVSPASRPVPVFDVLPSALFMPRLARKVPATLRSKRVLGPNDLIVTTSDLYQPTLEGADKNLSSDEENGDHREVVATICQPCKEDALAKGKAEICLNSGTIWEATPLPNGSYEFTANTDSGLMVLRWVRRGPKKRRVSAPPGSVFPEDSCRFTFSVIDPTTRRHPIIASMTRNHLEVYDRYSLPSTAPSSPTSAALSVISDGSEMDLALDQQVMETDEKLRLLITITSIWVAFREGWSHNFRYNDASLNGKATRSTSASRNVSTSTPGEEEASKPASADPNRRVVTWTAAASQPPTSDRSTQFGSLSKRSNSTGTAFLERANRRHSSMNRQSVASPRQSYDGSSEPKAIRPNSAHRSGSQQQEVRETTKLESTPVTPKAAHRSKHEGGQISIDGQLESPRPKGKRRHRFSNLFDFLIRKSGHHHQ
ncbi:hypothetical protein BDW60DRAFT_203453 [Aspergillus nidulans var. acristatus]